VRKSEIELGVAGCIERLAPAASCIEEVGSAVTTTGHNVSTLTTSIKNADVMLDDRCSRSSGSRGGCCSIPRNTMHESQLRSVKYRSSSNWMGRLREKAALFFPEECIVKFGKDNGRKNTVRRK
jgi:hypothetical protein